MRAGEEPEEEDEAAGAPLEANDSWHRRYNSGIGQLWKGCYSLGYNGSSRSRDNVHPIGFIDTLRLYRDAAGDSWIVIGQGWVGYQKGWLRGLGFRGSG